MSLKIAADRERRASGCLLRGLRQRGDCVRAEPAGPVHVSRPSLAGAQVCDTRRRAGKLLVCVVHHRILKCI